MMNRRFLLHFIFWLAIFLYTGYTILSQNETVWFAVRLSIELMVILLGITYSHFFIIQKYFEKKKYFSYSVFFFITFFFFLVLFQTYFSNYYNYKNDYIQTAASLFFIIFITSSLKLFRRTYYQKIKLKEIENNQLKIELQLLKNQINPHFLFNTLNTLYSYSLEKSDKLPEMIIKLSDLMRYLLKTNDNEMVDISEEIAFIQNYIHLEKLRLDQNYIITFEQHGNFKNRMISPLLIIPIVENCFKHGLDKIKMKGQIKISVSISENYFELITENCKVDLKKEKSGVSIENLKKRLELIYPKNYNLHISETENFYRSELKIIL